MELPDPPEGSYHEMLSPPNLMYLLGSHTVFSTIHQMDLNTFQCI